MTAKKKKKSQQPKKNIKSEPQRHSETKPIPSRARVHHYVDERRKEPMLTLREDWGDRGYGWWWCVKECLQEQPDLPRMKVSEVWILKLQTDCPMKTFEKFMDDLIKKYKLLVSDGEYIWEEDQLKVRNRYLKRRTAEKKVRPREQINPRKPAGFSLLGDLDKGGK